ncbi:MAG: hypothetical protein KJ893_04050 [Candidatus Omnitrophica bacterium]|nr:hypothetical protein [Candidatus Omnitrophota bacterium]MBU4478724.1 hypothetical protein [Candidatus Omnitrophota bacterium]MCG2703185.1 hypothetical protein [Candidatus Omnitrophota bacterium]
MKVFLILVAGCLVSAGLCVRAQALEENGIQFAAEISHIAYKEPGVMKEDGMMSGWNISYAYHHNLVLAAEGRFSFGRVDYTSNGTGDMEDIDDYLMELRALGGYDVSETEGVVLIIYSGFGYRFLQDDSQGVTTTTGALGYKRESNYYYIPIGMEATADIGNGMRVGLVLEYDFFWKGAQKSYLSSAVSGFNDLSNDQHKGYGYRAAVRVISEISDIDLIVEPFLRYWKMERSESADITYTGVIVGYGYEPKNYSTEYGLKIAVCF